ncbi:putative ubiquitin-specific processing protease 21 [Gigaspora margarita]|uniref:ubiquitinyl hydrolase 1 n=1 Tax=Gigaspora margarita TaxID=4874 RepID=A0A8H4B3M2_GIGMA|nr:putative ubiquitin-specific processing protease 21 [Gigaspora margarita]
MSRLVVTDYENFANSKMQHLDYEVEDFQFYTWNITDWRNLEGEVTSPEFVAGGWRWRISLYPLGNDDNDVVSIYLEFADRYIAPNGWHSCAQFAFALWNPEEPTEFVYRGGYQRFTAEGSNWGYPRFCEHRKLFVPLENQTHSLIENDSSIIQKKETGYITLKNEGTTGYLNATLQLLFSLTNFRKAVYQIPTENDIQDKCVPLAIQNIFYQMQTSDSPVGTKELMKSFGWDSLNSFMQHDAHEFNNVLRNNLENKMEGCKTLDDSFMDYIKEETLKGNNKYHTENYGLQDATKRVIFESFPSILQLELKRFEYDVQNATANKINDRHEFPMEIDLQKYLSPEADRSKPYKYLLYGVLVHSGYYDRGYYYALIRPRKNDKWLKFNDDRVIPVTDKEVFESSYGGDGEFSSAYVLVYIRESDIDNILYPMLPEDIPEHLQRRLDKEKIKETEEQKLYLCAKVITPKILNLHQGYGIANFNNPQYPLSEVLQFKVLKTETYSAFKGKLATNFKIPTEQIRFWALANNNIRLIADNYLSLSMSRICTGMGLEQNEMKLYLEISHKPINDETWFPVGNTHVMIFIKYFDANTQYLEGLGHIYIQKQNKIDSIFPILCDKKEFPPHTPLRIYNEANFGLIEELSHLKNGDIICFQKDLAEINKIGRVHDIPSFYKSLSARIIVQFKPKFKDGRQQPEFELALDKEYTYDIVASHVAAYLSTDPLKLRFTYAHITFGTPGSVIKRETNIKLASMFPKRYQSLPASANILYYEILDFSIVELETKKFLKILWIGATLKEMNVINVLLPKNSIIDDVFREILLNLSLPELTNRVRLFEVTNCKNLKEYKSNDSIDNIQEDATLYAEEITQDEAERDINDKVVQVYHFTKRPSCTHGIPFKFVIKAGEIFSLTKLRLQARLGMNEKDFAEVKIAIVQEKPCIKTKYIIYDSMCIHIIFCLFKIIRIININRCYSIRPQFIIR